MNYFVTGTDTDIGKTAIAAGLLCSARRQGLNAIGLKPVAAGAEYANNQHFSDDAKRLADGAGFAGPLDEINPVLLAPPIAPHVAAAQAGIALNAAELASWALTKSVSYQVALVEGAGGWLVPINETQGFNDIAKALGWPVILVVGMRLGCINHALLTAQSIRADGLTVAGWIANRVDPNQDAFEENVMSIKQRIGAPLLGVVPYLQSPTAKAVSDCLDWPVS